MIEQHVQRESQEQMKTPNPCHHQHPQPILGRRIARGGRARGALYGSLCFLLLVLGFSLLARQEAGSRPPGDLSQGPPSPPQRGAGRAQTLPPSPQDAPKAFPSPLDGISLAPGPNLVSLPEEPADTDPAAVLSAIAGAFTEVNVYDACDPADPWKLYDPTDPAASDLTRLDHTVAFRIEATQPADLPSDGTLPATTTFQLCPGWNLVSFPSAWPRHPRNALAPIEGKYVRILGYDPWDVADPWKIFDVNVPVWASDLDLLEPGRGYWILVTEPTTLVIANEGLPPTVELTAPEDLAVVTSPTEIFGTVGSALLDRWTLSYRGIGEADWTEFAAGTYPVTDANLGVFDPTLLLNGLYEIELKAVDLKGWEVSETIAVVVEGQMKIGNFTLSFTDLAIPVSGLDVEVVRTYDSRDKQKRDFGVGWTLDVRQGSYRNNRPPGDGWQIASGALPCQVALETKSHSTVVRLSEREIYRFAVRLFDVAATLGGCFARAAFEFVDGPVPGATLDILGNDEVFYENGSDQVVDTDTLEVYQPQQVKLTTRDGRVFKLDLDLGVTSLEDSNGNKLEITGEGIKHSSGKTIAFQRDAEDRITQISDPMKNSFQYFYDERGDLVQTIDQSGYATHFGYDDNHYFTEIIDPRGVQAIRSDYDTNGRLVKITDAFGRSMNFDHDVDGRREAVTNRLGFATILEYDQRGNVIRETDALENTVVRTYDNKDRLLTETDPLGNTTARTYNEFGDLTEFQDQLGNTARRTYDERGRVLTATDPRGKVTRYTYDSHGNLLTMTNPLGHATSFTYDEVGNPITTSNALQETTHMIYDSFGNLIATTNPLGHTTTHTYDANGRQLTETRSRTTGAGSEELVDSFSWTNHSRIQQHTRPDGTFEISKYNGLGEILQFTDSTGHSLKFSYDLAGRLTSVAFPDGTVKTETFDAEGKSLTKTDRAGRQTRFEYNPVGNLVAVLRPDGTSVGREYDALGRIVSRTDERGRITRFVYDPAGRVIEVIHSDGRSTSRTYDESGNLTSVTDAMGNRTTYEYDDTGRRIRINHPNGASIVHTFDEVNRLVAATDQNGLVTRFVYDANGRLVAVMDPLKQATTATYNEQAQISRTDAAGRTTHFEYDKGGRLLRRILPTGDFETWTYDIHGRLTAHTDFNGATTQYEYDENRRVTKVLYPDESTVEIAYNPSGDRSSVTDARGTTSFDYDARDRLIRVVHPDGSELAYAYDAKGNRRELRGVIPGSDPFVISYAYDSLDQLVRVTDPEGRNYDLSYDDLGRRTQVVYPNGIEMISTYDSMHHLTEVTIAATDGTVLRSFTVTRDPVGRPLRVEENDGTVREYTYDTLSRLVAEKVTHGSAKLVYEDLFTYDAVGNRLSSKRRLPNQEPIITTYSYDQADRLVSANEVSYRWDRNGNLSEIDGIASYTWDFENRLLGVNFTDGRDLRFRYDAEGVLERTEQSAPGHPAETNSFLNDTAALFSQVIAESDGNGKILRVHIDANQPLALNEASGSRYIHLDATGSVALITSEAGEITDNYSYQAFGTPMPAQGDPPPGRLYRSERFEPESRLYYLRARWMDPKIGRFISRDPVMGCLKRPKSLHPYAYATLDPLFKIDPSGLYGIGDAGISLLINLIGANANAAVVSTYSSRFHPAYLDPWDFWEVYFELVDARKIYRGYGINPVFDLPQAPPAKINLRPIMRREEALDQAGR